MLFHAGVKVFCLSLFSLNCAMDLNNTILTEMFNLIVLIS